MRFEILIQRTDQNRRPEAIERRLRLAMTLEPRFEILAVITRQPGHERQHRARDGHLVLQIKNGGIEERRRGVKRGGQRAGPQRRGLAAGKDEGDLVVPANLLLNAETAIEVNEIGAATEKNVLAVVDHLAGAGKLVRRRAATEVGAALEELDVITSVSQRARRRQSGKAPADDGDRTTARIVASSRHRYRQLPRNRR